MSANEYQLIKQLRLWKQKIYDNWQHVTITGDKLQHHQGNIPVVSGEKISLDAIVTLGSLSPDDVMVELYYGSMNSSGNVVSGEYEPMQFIEEINSGTYRYQTELELIDGGEYGFNFRIIPITRDLTDKFELRLVKWAEKCIN